MYLLVQYSLDSSLSMSSLAIHLSMCYYMCVLEGAYVWCVILVPFVVRDGEYGNGIGVIFCC